MKLHVNSKITSTKRKKKEKNEIQIRVHFRCSASEAKKKMSLKGKQGKQKTSILIAVEGKERYRSCRPGERIVHADGNKDN